MGIPTFYRWLSEKYPLSITNVIQQQQQPIDTSTPNPNGVEFDNLYLDMNGIIHPCFHPEDKPGPSSYQELYKAMFEYIDHLFQMVRPRKLLYMAIDGVAPRAKMNQQRSRRFRRAKEAEEEAAAAAAEEAEEVSNGRKPQVELEKISALDSNVITPGTEFMTDLSAALRYYIHLRLNSDPGWRGIKVILSDANVPGEGEHKVASYIRSQRNQPGFDPNTRHCLYGLDADLIMLALASHEIHFSILREDVRVPRSNFRGGKFDKNAMKRGKGDGKRGLHIKGSTNSDLLEKKFQFLNIWVLRDYLEIDLRIFGATTDVERLIDDFVFMCLFVGNDFLPHVPSLEISEGAIDLLLSIYKKEFKKMGGYLTNSSEVDLERVEHFLQVVGSNEDSIFRRRSQMKKERDIHFANVATPTKFQQKITSDFQKQEHVINTNKMNNTSSNIATNDQVKLGEEGWKKRYYAEKFEAKDGHECEIIQRDLVKKYVEGICWVMNYYYRGVCSWQWFYPYHYAPFASDFLDLKNLEIHFTLGIPFKPFDQLMGVLPAASAHALPLAYRSLMTDPSSSIADFYPKDFELDLNGKRFSWQAVCKLPFIEESRLLAVVRKVEHSLTDDEKQRNSWALDMLFVNISHPLAPKIFSFYERKKDHPKLAKAQVKRKIDPKFSDGMNGCMYISHQTIYSKQIYSPIEEMETINNNQTIFVYFKVPSQIHINRPPDGVVFPKKFITSRDVKKAVLWHERRFYASRKKWEGEQKSHERNQCNAILGKRKRVFDNSRAAKNRHKRWD